MGSTVKGFMFYVPKMHWDLGGKWKTEFLGVPVEEQFGSVQVKSLRD